MQNKGQLFDSELIQQHQASDLAWNSFNVAVLQQQNNIKLKALIVISQKFTQLQELRVQVVQQNIDTALAIKNYSSFINQLFNEI